MNTNYHAPFLEISLYFSLFDLDPDCLDLYNALTVHSLTRLRPLPSVSSRLAYTHEYAYHVASWRFTLNDLLHVMLRG